MTSLVALLKMLPFLESAVMAVWKGYEKYKIQYEMEQSAQLVAKAKTTESTKEINEEIK